MVGLSILLGEGNSKCALGCLGDWVPTGFRHPRGFAALAARSITRISAATTAIPCACEAVPQDIVAADITLGHTDIATALVAGRTLESVALLVPALHRIRSTLGVLCDGVPATLRAFGLAALAARCIACVSAAPTALALAWKAVPIHILAADIPLAHTSTATAPISASTLELGSVTIPARHWRQAPPRGFIRG